MKKGMQKTKEAIFLILGSVLTLLGFFLILQSMGIHIFTNIEESFRINNLLPIVFGGMLMVIIGTTYFIRKYNDTRQKRRKIKYNLDYLKRNHWDLENKIKHPVLDDRFIIKRELNPDKYGHSSREGMLIDEDFNSKGEYP